MINVGLKHVTRLFDCRTYNTYKQNIVLYLRMRIQNLLFVCFRARDAKHFKMMVHIKPFSMTTCTLEYEQLLVRKLGMYEHVIILSPGQVVQDFVVSGMV